MACSCTQTRYWTLHKMAEMGKKQNATMTKILADKREEADCIRSFSLTKRD